jgi:hypothetical protein
LTLSPRPGIACAAAGIDRLPDSPAAPATADRGLDLGEFGRLLNSGKIEDLRKIAEVMTKNPARFE